MMGYCREQVMYILTKEGQQKALEIKLGKKPSQEPAPHININHFTANGPTQLGNNNNQNIEYFFQELADKIDASDASLEEKKTAKQMLANVLQHPIFCTLLGVGAQAIIDRLLR
jgi:hypothetical protein